MYQQVMDGQDAEIVSYLERFGNEPLSTGPDRSEPNVLGTQWARTMRNGCSHDEPQAADQDLRGGDDRTRTGDPLLAKQVL